ncbi:DUF2489 domain-containing protein [Azotobacter beijerinckii]|uniref:DUF2489 domain-containing protein n=1 Tax=Azotobacter beijerinckii TaxID=170623 RepID=A0A1I4CKM9_9GAMM|nr:DUF2489 domain-containing protein [Azotobacter beijerinckii]SFB37707.1 Protein of unknown function [Azotobacter beijerinckii]SFK80839.1 Protein of unknown function [Azotobacter beijerinckii]
MNPLTVGLLLAALLIVLALSGVAFALWRQVWLRQKARKAAEEDRQTQLAEHLRILAGSLLDGQLPLVEGAIRIKALLEHYDPQLSRSERCRVFHELGEATAHIPTHAAWKALDRAQRRHYEALFSSLELRHKAAARSSARWLLEEGLAARR